MIEDERRNVGMAVRLGVKDALHTIWQEPGNGLRDTSLTEASGNSGVVAGVCSAQYMGTASVDRYGADYQFLEYIVFKRVDPSRILRQSLRYSRSNVAFESVVCDDIIGVCGGTGVEHPTGVDLHTDVRGDHETRCLPSPKKIWILGLALEEEKIRSLRGRLSNASFAESACEAGVVLIVVDIHHLVAGSSDSCLYGVIDVHSETIQSRAASCIQWLRVAEWIRPEVPFHGVALRISLVKKLSICCVVDSTSPRGYLGLCCCDERIECSGQSICDDAGDFLQG